MFDSNALTQTHPTMYGASESSIDAPSMAAKRVKATKYRNGAILCLVLILAAALAGVFVGRTGVAHENATRGGQKSGKAPWSWAPNRIFSSGTSGTCDSDQVFLPAPYNTCVVCLNPQTPPKIPNEQCPAGTYYDEEETCSCILCEKNFCCRPGDVMNDCPIGSFQAARGGKTCDVAVVSSETAPFEYQTIVGSPLNKDAVNAQQLTLSKDSLVSCPSTQTRKVAAVISGMMLDDSQDKLSLTISPQAQNGQKNAVTISKVANSKISGAAFSLVETCVPKDSIMTIGKLRAKMKSGQVEKKTLVTNLKCQDAVPRVFAAINEIDTTGKTGAFSLSIKASVRSNANGFVRPRVEFRSKNGAITAGAAVVTYCSSDVKLFGQGLVETGLIDGSDFSSAAVSGASKGEMMLVKNVTFENEMQCDSPQVALGLTRLEATQNVAVNVEFVRSSKKSFEMKFVAMGGTKVSAIEGTYLATCKVNKASVTKAVEKTCGVQKKQLVFRDTSGTSGNDTFRLLDFAVPSFKSLTFSWQSSSVEVKFPVGYTPFGSGVGINPSVAVTVVNSTNVPAAFNRGSTNVVWCKVCGPNEQVKFGDSCWGLVIDNKRDCGCNSAPWDGTGMYYGGNRPSMCNKCKCWGGGFSGYTGISQKKGGVNVGVTITVNM